MNVSDLRITYCILLISFVTTISSCHSQSNTQNKKTEQQAPQIAEYVFEIFEDSKGNLWFGTNKGAVRYHPRMPDPAGSDGNGTPNSNRDGQGKSLTYFTIEDGLIGNTVTSFAEDKKGNMWFGTHSGLSKYDARLPARTGSDGNDEVAQGKTFINFTEKEGLVNNRVSELLIDKKGILWIGTWGGVSRLEGKTFSTFTLPVPDVALLSYQTTMNWVTEIIEDKDGNIWISRDGYGVCKYDGKSFTHYTKKDGLVSNNIQEILEDRNGIIWFGSRVVERDNPDSTGRMGEGGLSRFDPSPSIGTGSKPFTHFPEIKGLNKNEIYSLYADRKGNLWIGANRVGLYRYDARLPARTGSDGNDSPESYRDGQGNGFTLFSETDRADLMPYGYGIQSILEDKKGNIWLGLSGGLFRLKGNSIINVSQNGPWD
jgi:ligand-binding sensor domain-containing protein